MTHTVALLACVLLLSACYYKPPRSPLRYCYPSYSYKCAPYYEGGDL